MSGPATPIVYVASVWGFLGSDVGAADSGIVGIITSAGVGSVALAVGWALLKRSDARERQITTDLRLDLDAERTTHEATRAALLALLLKNAEEAKGA